MWPQLIASSQPLRLVAAADLQALVSHTHRSVPSRVCNAFTAGCHAMQTSTEQAPN